MDWIAAGISGFAVGTVTALAVLWRCIFWLRSMTDQMTEESDRLKACREEMMV